MKRLYIFLSLFSFGFVSEASPKNYAGLVEDNDFSNLRGFKRWIPNNRDRRSVEILQKRQAIWSANVAKIEVTTAVPPISSVPTVASAPAIPTVPAIVTPLLPGSITNKTESSDKQKIESSDIKLKLSDDEKEKLDKEFEAYMPTDAEHHQATEGIDNENAKMFGTFQEFGSFNQFTR